MIILIALGVIVFLFLYIKFKSFRGFTNNVIKDIPNQIEKQANTHKKNK